MGMFSWLDCRTGEQIVDGKCRLSYLLVPEEFGGGHIEEPCYEGYGEFGERDVYELVAEWNRGDVSYEKNVSDKRWAEWRFNDKERARQLLDDFNNGESDGLMRVLYGDGYLRTIGILIAGSDCDNCRLRYPIKITHDREAVYEWCAPSRSDPNQGWEQ